MKKLIALCLAFVFVLGLAGCGETKYDETKYKVTFADSVRVKNKKEIHEKYAAGEEVEIVLSTISCHYYEVRVNGEKIEMDRERSDLQTTYFSFIMPAEDVRVEIDQKAAPIPIAP